MKNYWLMKSEPQLYSINDLKKDGKTLWDGVRNYQARNFLRQMKKGDLSFFYHSNITPPGIVGLMRINKCEIPDPTQFNSQSPYYDSSATSETPRWYTVEVELVEIFQGIISLPLLKAQFHPDELLLLRRGNRLSVMPVTTEVAEKILELAK